MTHEIDTIAITTTCRQHAAAATPSRLFFLYYLPSRRGRRGEKGIEVDHLLLQALEFGFDLRNSLYPR
jgi:hypothetical protein